MNNYVFSKLLIFLSLQSGFLIGSESFQSVQNEEPEESQIVMPCLRGLRLIPLKKDVLFSNLENIEYVEIYHLEIPGTPEKLKGKLKDFWDTPITQDALSEISQEVLRYYQSYHRPLVNIQVPSQPLSSGVLQLVVQESHFGTVSTVGNKNFSNKQLEKHISLKKGDPIKTNWLASDLNLINRNPFRTTNLLFVPSQVSGYTDIELVTQDQFPWRFYSGVDNTGIAQSGHNRWFVGLNWGNVFGLDHIFTYQFTMGSHYNEFWAHSVNYTAPLSWNHTLDLYGGYSQVRAQLQNQPGISTHGSSAQASFRYEIPLPVYDSLLSEFVWGFDWKRINTGLLNNDVFFLGKVANITQLVAEINGGFETTYTKNSATIELFGSPGEWLPDQENSHYNTLRAGAKNTYLYTRGSLASILRLYKNFTFEPTFRVQFSTTNLLASEQFGLGGHDTVRGYEEREVNVDNAFLMNLEFRTPPFSLLSSSSKFKRKGIEDNLILLAFLDYGYGWNHETFFNEPNAQHLLGVGPGLRYVMQRYLTIRADYGFKLHQPKLSPNPNQSMFYFGVVASY